MRTIFITLILTFILGGFVSSKAQNNQQLNLRVKQQKTVTKDKLKIKFVSVLEDSRCPRGTNCIWAGNARVQIKISDAKGVSKNFELNMNANPQSISFAGYEIKMTNLDPKPASNIRINGNAYTATFLILKS